MIIFVDISSYGTKLYKLAEDIFLDPSATAHVKYLFSFTKFSLAYIEFDNSKFAFDRSSLPLLNCSVIICLRADTGSDGVMALKKDSGGRKR